MSDSAHASIKGEEKRGKPLKLAVLHRSRWIHIAVGRNEVKLGNHGEQWAKNTPSNDLTVGKMTHIVGEECRKHQSLLKIG